MPRWIAFVVMLVVGLSGLASCALLPHRACHFCGAVLAAHTAAGAGELTPEGYEVCHRCKVEAVRDERTARSLVGQVRADLVRLGLTLPWGAIPVKLTRFGTQ